MFQTALDALRIDFDADHHTPVERDRQRLRAAHAAKTCGDGERSSERSTKALAGDRRERLVGPLQDSLCADVDPRARRHLAVHRQAECFQSPELLPRRPFRHEHRVGDEDARRPFVGVERRGRGCSSTSSSQLLAASPGT